MNVCFAPSAKDRISSEKKIRERILHKSDPTASTTYNTCCGRTNSPRYSEFEKSDTAGDALRSLFVRSTLSWSPSRLAPFCPLTQSTRRRRTEPSSSPHSDATPTSKYRIPPHVPSFHCRPSSFSSGQLSPTGTSMPTQGPDSPSTSPI